jgi:hypothetical protein
MGFKNAMSSREKIVVRRWDLPILPQNIHCTRYILSVLLTHSTSAEFISKERVQQEEGGISRRGAEKASEAELWFLVFASKQVLEPRIESLAQRLSFQ